MVTLTELETAATKVPVNGIGQQWSSMYLTGGDVLHCKVRKPMGTHLGKFEFWIRPRGSVGKLRISKAGVDKIFKNI